MSGDPPEREQAHRDMLHTVHCEIRSMGRRLGIPMTDPEVDAMVAVLDSRPALPRDGTTSRRKAMAYLSLAAAVDKVGN